MAKTKKKTGGSPEKSETESAPKISKVVFHYIKSYHFRVIHVDGIHGGPSPRGLLQMAVFNERRPIPQQITHEIENSDVIGKEIERIAREGFVREVEAELLMNLDVAKGLHQWLGEKINVLEKLLKDENAGGPNQ